MAGRKAQAPVPRGARSKAARAQVAAGAGRAAVLRAHELGVEELLGGLAGIHDALALAAGHAALGLLYLDVGAICQLAHRLGELELLAFHDVAEDVPALAAAEAVVELAVGQNMEGRRFLPVERAQTPIAAAFWCEGHIV